MLAGLVVFSFFIIVGIVITVAGVIRKVKSFKQRKEYA